jgi:hypothetical protein
MFFNREVALSDDKAAKASGHSSKRSIFGTKRTLAPCAELGAQETTGQIVAGAERARQESTRPRLPEAESMLPKAALHELRRTALAK